MKLYTLIDSKQYVQTNCYQHQMSIALEERFDVHYVTLDSFDFSKVPAGAPVLSRLRLRSIVQNLPRLKGALASRPIMVYDQDPWESFLANSTYSGAYQKIYDTLNVSTFLNVSHWWRDRVLELGLPSRFVQIWTLPQYCRSEPIPWKQRQHDAVFCGTLYSRRKAFFDDLARHGVNVEVIPAGKSFVDYLNAIANSRVAIRSERVEWPIITAQGPMLLTSANALWKRDIETAAVGCFSMRDLDAEAKSWSVDDISTIVPFLDAEGAAGNFQRIMSLHPDDADALIKQGIEYVKNAPGWNITCDVIEDVLRQ